MVHAETKLRGGATRPVSDVISRGYAGATPAHVSTLPAIPIIWAESGIGKSHASNSDFLDKIWSHK